MSPLRCLFCNHRNPAGAKYCNGCAAELNLQPCNQCGAIDKRTAITCYKCGTQFNVPAAPRRAAAKRARPPAASELAAVLAAPELAAVPAAPVPESAPALPNAENQLAKPGDRASAIERAFLSRSPARGVSLFREGSRREVTETPGQAARVTEWDPTPLSSAPAQSAVEPQPLDQTVAPESVENFDLASSTIEPQPTDETVESGSAQNPDLTQSAVELERMDKPLAPETVQYPVLALSAVEPLSIDETVESERAATATAWRRPRRLAFVTLLLAATAASGYFYYDRSAQQLGTGQSAGQPAPSTPAGPISSGATAATVATPVDAPSAPKDTTSQPATGAEEVEKAPSSPARIVAKPRTDPEPVVSNQPLGDPASVRRPAAVPQAAGGVSSVRRSSVIDAGGRKDPPAFRECTEAIAALGLCSPSR